MDVCVCVYTWVGVCVCVCFLYSTCEPGACRVQKRGPCPQDLKLQLVVSAIWMLGIKHPSPLEKQRMLLITESSP